MRPGQLLVPLALFTAPADSPYARADAERDRAVFAWVTVWREVTTAQTLRAAVTARRLSRFDPPVGRTVWSPAPLRQGEPDSGAWVVHLAGDRLGMDAVEPGWTDRWVIEGADVRLSRRGGWVLEDRVPGDELAAALWGLREWAFPPPVALFDPADLPGLELAGRDRVTMRGPGFDLHVGITDGRVQEIALVQPPCVLIVEVNHDEINQGLPDGVFGPRPRVEEERRWFEQVSPASAAPW